MEKKRVFLQVSMDDDFNEINHREPTEEFYFYRAVAKGDLDAVRMNCKQQRFLETDGVGVLSKNPVTNIKYHFVITTAMITRFCGQNGLELEQAYRMSDFYIQKLDTIHTVQEVQSLHDEMVLHYTEKMRRYHQNDTNSKHVNACKEHIYKNLTERITVDAIADELGVSSSYLSRLFKKEVGVSISTYIRDLKIESAKELLKYGEMSMIEIANHLSFSSQSHFIQQFRDATGVTPKKYRDENAKLKWDR
ncbi:TPA: helix-turn-helix domain-containing protein [Streptococcus suis]|nr:helix-turn-helix domain-containing protein [Streptococcus suis]